MNLPKFALQHKPVVIAFVIVLVIWGFNVFQTAPRREDPAFLIRDAVITCEWPGATAEKVDRLVTDKIENAMTEIKYLRRIRSTSYVGRSVVNVTGLDEVSNVDMMYEKLRAELKLIEPELPEGCKPPQVNDKFGAAAAMVLAIYQDPSTFEKHRYSSAQIEQYAKLLRDRILDLRPLMVDSEGKTIPDSNKPGYVARLEMFGVRPEVIYLEADAGLWSQLKVGSDQLQAVLEQRNVVAPAGLIDSEGGRMTVRLTGDFDATREVERVIVDRVASGAEAGDRMTASEFIRNLQTGAGPGGARPTSQSVPVYLEDLGIKVFRDYQDPPQSMCRVADAEVSSEAIILSFTLKDGMNITEMGAAVERMLATINDGILPPDMLVAKVADQPATVQTKVSEVTANLIDSILIVLVVLLFLAGPRVALVCAIAIPMIMLMAIGLMRFWNVEIEQISLAALIISLGILVDNAIQVSDNTARFMSTGMDPDLAAAEGPRQIAFPLLIATGTIVGAFLPMLFALKGGTQEYVRSLPIVVSLALIGGWIFSMTMTPIMCRALVKPSSGPPLTRFFMWIKSKLRKGPPKEGGESAYQKLLRVAIAGKLVVIAGAIVYYVLASQAPVPSSFFPMAESKTFVVEWYLPDSAPYHRTQDVSEQVQKLVQSLDTKTYDAEGKLVDFVPEGDKPAKRINNLVVFVGDGGPRFYLGLDPKASANNYGIMWVNTTDTESVPQFVEDVRQAAAVGVGAPGSESHIPPIGEARVVAKRLVMGTPVPTPIEVRIHGPRLGSERVLRSAVERIEQGMRDTGIAWDVHNSWGEYANQLDVEIRQDAASMSGVTSLAVANSLNAYYSGHYLTSYREGDKQIPIMLRLPPEQRRSLSELRNTYVEGYTGKVPLDAVADIGMAFAPSKITRYQRERMMGARAMPETGFFAMQVTNHPKVREAIADVEATLPPGYRIELGGIDEAAMKEADSSAMASIIAGVIILLLLIIQYNSVLKPLMVLSTVPLATVSGMLGLYLMGLPSGFMEGLGMIALLGIMLSAGILMVDFSSRLVADKLEAGEDLAEEGTRGVSGLTKQGFRDCLSTACGMRLMPIMMTTLTTVGGLLPLMMGSSPLFKGLATVVVVGLSIGTLMTLFVLPAVIAFFAEILGVHLAPDADPRNKVAEEAKA